MAKYYWEHLPEGVKDTTKIQLQSLVRFAKQEVGASFDADDANFNFRGTVIRFNTMVKWHNFYYGDDKIVKNVKMQRQKDGSVLVQNHLVKFLKPVYKMVFFDRDFHLSI